MNEEETGKLYIYRESHLLGKLRAYSILVDGVKVDSVKDGAQTLIFLSPVAHNVTIRFDWKKSNTVTINTKIGKTIKLNICYKKLKGWKLYVLSGAWMVTALVGATFSIGALVGIGVVGFMFNRVGKMHLYQK